MREFFNVVPPSVALTTLLDRLEVSVRSEVVPTAQALGRVTAEDVVSREDLPPYPRSTMDGYSVRARDTFGASESLPAFCDVVGEVAMGSQPQVALSTGQAAVTYTGGMLAEGADAVVMVENTQRVGDGSIEILRPVAPGENVIQVGEDAKVGERVIPKGRLIRPQDVGVLFGLGITEVSVAQRPKVAIVSTGDELVPPEQSPTPGQVRDINSYSVASLVQDAGGVPVHIGVVPDEFEAQRQAAVRRVSVRELQSAREPCLREGPNDAKCYFLSLAVAFIPNRHQVVISEGSILAVQPRNAESRPASAVRGRSVGDQEAAVAGRRVGAQPVQDFLPGLLHLRVNIFLSRVRPDPVEVIAPLHLPRRECGDSPQAGMAHALLIGVVVDVLMGHQVREWMPAKHKLQFLKCVVLAAVAAEEGRLIPKEPEGIGAITRGRLATSQVNTSMKVSTNTRVRQGRPLNLDEVMSVPLAVPCALAAPVLQIGIAPPGPARTAAPGRQGT